MWLLLLFWQYTVKVNKHSCSVVSGAVKAMCQQLVLKNRSRLGTESSSAVCLCFHWLTFSSSPEPQQTVLVRPSLFPDYSPHNSKHTLTPTHTPTGSTNTLFIIHNLHTLCMWLYERLSHFLLATQTGLRLHAFNVVKWYSTTMIPADWLRLSSHNRRSQRLPSPACILFGKSH